jgi:hypothetical protein
MEFEDEENVRAELKLGTWRMLMVSALDRPLGRRPSTRRRAPRSIASLDPDVFEQLREAVDVEGDVACATRPKTLRRGTRRRRSVERRASSA